MQGVTVALAAYNTTKGVDVLKTRIITGAVAGIGAIAILLFFPVWAIRLMAAAVLVIAMHELLAAENCKHKGVTVAALAFAAACPFLDMWNGFSLLWIVLIAYMLVLGMLLIISHESLPFEHIAYVLAMSVAVVLPIGSLAYIRALPSHGIAYLFLTMIIAWFSDMGAYFVGSFLGKHKLCEKISPKKTVEGFFGGILTAVLFSLLGAWIYQTAFLDAAGQQVCYWLVALVALVTAPISVVGDLFCSVIKRHRGIKDFGKIFPGHGGILDRFDSLVFVAPILFILCQKLPLIV